MYQQIWSVIYKGGGMVWPSADTPEEALSKARSWYDGEPIVAVRHFRNEDYGMSDLPVCSICDRRIPDCTKDQICGHSEHIRNLLS